MGDSDRNAGAEELLLNYLRSDNEEESESVLSELISTHVTPLIQEIVRYKLRARISDDTARGTDSKEVCSGVLVKVLDKLRKWKTHPDYDKAGGFLDYVAVTTYHACNQYWRESHPLRNRLKNRLLYILNHRNEMLLG
jgi:hypothetical protein